MRNWLPQCNLHPAWMVAGFLVLIAGFPAQAQQYEGMNGFEVAWKLDPRAHPELFTHGPGFGSSVVLAGMDFDGDGNKEILFATDETVAPAGPDPGYLDVFLYENTGDNAFEYVWHYTYPEPSNSFPPLIYGDMDQDGLWEIFLGIPTIDNEDKLFIFEQNEDKTFPDIPTAVFGYEREAALDFRPSGFALADVDDDGDIELMTVTRTSGRREFVIISAPTGIDALSSFLVEFEAGESLLGGGGIYDLDVVDYDGDGNKEVWVNTWDLMSMTIFEATAPDTYELQVDITRVNPDPEPAPGVDHGSYNRHRLTFADLDGDGNMEFIWPTTEGYLYYLGESSDVSTLQGTDFMRVGRYTPVKQSRGSDIGDLDGDGKLDIVAGNGTGEQLIRIEYQGGNPADSLSYTWETILDAGSADAEEAMDFFYPLRIADDLDGDGNKEIVVTNRRASDEGQALILVVEYTGAPSPIEPMDGVPATHLLEQNYPNPFRGATAIGFGLSQAGHVSLRVFNVMGQEVRTLVGGEFLTAGSYSAAWDGQSNDGARLADGVYLYVLEVGGTRLTRKMTLIR